MGFIAKPLAIPDVIVIETPRFEDRRGYFAETFRQSAVEKVGIAATFVQDNEAMSRPAGTIRGLHFQAGPNAQAKLVRVISGAVFDVAVDIRQRSPTYGRWVGERLTAESGKQLFIPRGFAHGYCTLKPETVIAYKCDDYNEPAAEGGIHYADPTLAIAWPLTGLTPIVSDRDNALPTLDRFKSPFVVEVSA